jgi:hypothetical protein
MKLPGRSGLLPVPFDIGKSYFQVPNLDQGALSGGMGFLPDKPQVDI